MSRDTTNSTGALIAQLVDGLEPVRPLRFSSGMGFALAGLGVTLATVALMFGVRPDVLAGRFDPVFLLATGLFLLLGLASAVTVIVMSRPRVGSDHGGWVWAAATTALLPAAAAIIGLGRGKDAISATSVEHGLDCLTMGSGLALMTFAVLVWWLRRGAPTSPERAGLLTGVAAGSFGIFAFSFHCIYSDIVHIGLWHSAVVVVSAAIGQIVVPPIIRW
ncbi:MAG: DUF1109 domain-containing protein [Alphaproteobacteria bacterium HGW-Alphaproteobacteria-13]|nr:MAG: DUF1109 domain-containing protein [Alphaproteobacteria bacterium HGW-Alphaproteobacteria-13]